MVETNLKVVKCPVCGKIKKSQGNTAFRCCNNQYALKDNMIVATFRPKRFEKMENCENEPTDSEVTKVTRPEKSEKMVENDTKMTENEGQNDAENGDDENVAIV